MEREPLISVVEKVVKRLAAEVINRKYVGHAIRDVNVPALTVDKLDKLVEEAKEQFERTAISKVNSLIEEDDVEAKVDELVEIIKNTDPNAKGWRPLGEPFVDVFGHIRPALLEHVERLEEIKQSRLNELEEKKACLKELRKQLELLDDGTLRSSAPSGFRL